MEEDEKVTQQLGEEPDAPKQTDAPTKEDTGNEAQVEEPTASGQSNEAEEPMAEQDDQDGGSNEDVSAAPTDEDASEDEQPEATAPVQTAEPAKVVCPKCGAENDAAVAYCPKCGAKLEGAAKPAAKGKQGEKPAPSISLDDLAALQESEKPQKADAKAWLAKNKIVAAIAAAVVVVLAALVVPPMLATPDDLFEQGKYEQAYQKSADEDKPAMLARICGAGEFQTAYDLAPDDDARTDVLASICGMGKFQAAYDLASDSDEKHDILVANIAAKECADIAEGLKDPSSFKLKSMYYYPGAICLTVTGANGYGAEVQGYYALLEDDSKCWFNTYYAPDLEEDDDYYSIDSSQTRLRKDVRNSIRELFRTMISKKLDIDSRYVDAINQLFENGRLSSVSVLPDVVNVYDEMV